MFTSVFDKITLFTLKLKNEIAMGPISGLKDKGQGLVEYAVILALIAVVVIAIMNVFGIRLVTVFDRILCYLDPNTQLPDVKGTTATCAGYGIH